MRAIPLKQGVIARQRVILPRLRLTVKTHQVRVGRVTMSVVIAWATCETGREDIRCVGDWRMQTEAFLGAQILGSVGPNKTTLGRPTAAAR